MKIKDKRMKAIFLGLICSVLISESRGKKNPLAKAAATVMGNQAVQAAVVDKGIEVAGTMVDKFIENTDEAQEKAANLLKKEIKLDIVPDKGWENQDMFKPPGYHIDATVEGGAKPPHEKGEPVISYPAGLGYFLMNGCFGTDYGVNDPCYDSKATTTSCTDQIDGASFLGVGFDGRGKYSPESRKMSIVQRNCVNRATYDGLDVPDTMNVHGIYDTSASLVTFESREEYRKILQEEAGVSGSYFGFSAGVKEAWGESTQSSQEKFMAMLDVDVDRYEIFMDEVKPTDLTVSFLREFMELPTSYFSVDGPLKYQNFIQRWGTHYIKSSKFGGQLEIRKTMDKTDAGTKKEFEVQMEMEFKTLFASVGAKAAAESGNSMRKQTKTTSTSVIAQGGSQDIASILSDVYSPTFKTEFKEWLETIPTYPKPFIFQMGAITNLLNFRANDLFPDETPDRGCEAHAGSLETEEKDGKTLKYYEFGYEVGGQTKRKKHYCKFEDRQALEDAIQRRRSSLERAIEIYMEEGAVSISNIELKTCERKRDQPSSGTKGDSATSYSYLPWKEIVKGNAAFRVSFDMLDDLPSALGGSALNIKRNMSRLVRFRAKKWRTSDQDGTFHLYGIFDNGGSKDISKLKMSILGLVLTFNEKNGRLYLSPQDYTASKKMFPTLGKEMVGSDLARVEMPPQPPIEKPRKLNDPVPLTPCNVDWSNALRLDPTDSKGKCLHFTASTEGSIFVVFAALPKEPTTWYSVEISPARVATYKGITLKTQTDNVNARALGDASLYQSYFVCITESEKNTLIEYGKSLGTADSGDIYLNMVDSEGHLNVRFYAFGNDESPAKVMDAHIIPREMTIADCKGDTVRDMDTNLCVQDCHKDCDPLAGCKVKNDNRVPEGCYACRVAKDIETSRCVAECPRYKYLSEDKKCYPTFDVLIKPSFPFRGFVSHFPILKELTLCMWLKLVDVRSLVGARWQVVRYDIQGNPAMNFAAEIKGNRDSDLQLTFNVPNSGSHYVNVDALKNGRWHHICVSWSGYTGVRMYYTDGARVYSQTDAKGQIDGGGVLSVGQGHAGATIEITEINLWKTALSDLEIADMAGSSHCHAGTGNLKKWYQWYSGARRLDSQYYRADSQCQT